MSAFGIRVLLLSTLLAGAVSWSQSLYKYRGPDGEWVYTDREPEGQAEAEVRALPRGADGSTVRVYRQETEDGVALYAQNDFHAPVQVVLGIEELRGFVRPDQSLRFVVPARQEILLTTFAVQPEVGEASMAYRYVYLIGDPAARHRPTSAYRAPFAVAGEHRISQAYPLAVTHSTIDSQHAVDIAMPIGTDIHAARGGIVVEVASTNFRAGPDPSETGAQANLVRILHDDGTFAVYAHLNWNTIRVRPGDLVQRGQYIADSGNTGFSSGPHLHFAVLRNADLRYESLPVTFEGANGSVIVPKTGALLTAY